MICDFPHVSLVGTLSFDSKIRLTLFLLKKEPQRKSFAKRKWCIRGATRTTPRCYAQGATTRGEPPFLKKGGQKLLIVGVCEHCARKLLIVGRCEHCAQKLLIVEHANKVATHEQIRHILK